MISKEQEEYEKYQKEILETATDSEIRDFKNHDWRYPLIKELYETGQYELLKEKLRRMLDLERDEETKRGLVNCCKLQEIK
jgi:hypothetical protein